MSDQGTLDLFAPAVRPVSDQPVRIPHQSGSHSSWTGSRAVVEVWPERQAVVLQLLSGGPKTRQELAALTPYQINGVCSVVKALLRKGAIEWTGDYDMHIVDGETTTKRERLRIKR